MRSDKHVRCHVDLRQGVVIQSVGVMVQYSLTFMTVRPSGGPSQEDQRAVTQ